MFFYDMGSEALAQVAQESGGCPVLIGHEQGPIGVLVHCIGVGLDGL